MNKLWLIIKREYLSRVRKGTFILATILTPIGFVLFFVALIFIMSSGSEEKRLAVLDEANILQLDGGRSLRETSIKFKPVRVPLDSLKKSFEAQDFDGILYIPAQDTAQIRTVRIEYFSNQQLGVTATEFIKNTVNNHLRELKKKRLGLDENVLKSLETSVIVSPKPLKPEEAESEKSTYRVYVATFLGGAMMLLIYVVIFIYGNMVMRSVMEEKTSRIVEVIVSSVKPFQLMLGKIIGVGAVGLTQFAIWAVVFPLLYLGVGLIFAGQLQEMQQAQMAASQIGQGDATQIAAIASELWSFDYSTIILYFILYFLMGYVLYASLFAAVGSAMSDDSGEGQSLTLLISLPGVVAFYIGASAVENPNSGLAFWSSLVPLFSPVVMPARIVFEPPFWQILLSLGILLLSAAFFVWLAGRIYRVGVLMYGKKVTLRELAKWIFYKD